MTMSKKIINEVEKIDKDEPFKKLVLDILDLESKGTHYFKSKCEELVKKYIDDNRVGVISNDKD